MFFGFFSVVSAFHGDFAQAAWSILLAAVFDALDGRVARLAKATSHFGVEYDSLCDLVSFGVAPAVLFYLWVAEPWGRIGWMIAFLFLACGALRLARFNVTTEVSDSSYFQGMPIPLAAGLVATFFLFSNALDFVQLERFRELAAAFFVILALLMVSSVPFFSFKKVHWQSRATVLVLVLLLGILFLAVWKPDYFLFLTLISYVLLNLAGSMVRTLLRKNHEAQS